ncbi:unnamed protein product [Arctia plantaginis]|uniref:Uncharacterized protein n=1 Tax=Arctia plantaginis TaxID=874455 RepID=A0A8S1ACP2_ARCPL|nr:unnamed protein product [Arctia plantaginis]
MDKIKTRVLKSKSSNTTISRDSKKQDKKSRSNAEIQPLSFKKRGVYVEKKSTKTSMTEDIENTPKKPKVIPRPGKKRFLDSILTILSKSTTGTQFPEMSDKNNKIKMKKKKLHEQNLIGDLNTIKKQPKYRSRVLNVYKDLDMDKVVVLQSKKEIIQTPSNYSQRSKDRESIKWSDMIPPQKTDSDVTVVHTDAKDQQLSLIDHIEYGNEVNERNDTRIRNNNEPITLIAKEEQKDNNKLYDFFVDLLESTFNVYNATEQKTEPAASSKSSKLVLEPHGSEDNKFNTENIIDYNVIDNKFNIENVIDYNGINNEFNMENEYNDIEDTRNEERKTKQEYLISDDWDNTLLDDVPSLSLRDICPEQPLTAPKVKRKLKSESFSYKKKNVPPVTRSFIYQNVNTPPKKSSKKGRKKNLLNLLIEQLQMEANRFEPPKNFFESLQMMAKYKNRCQKSIHFEESAKKVSEGSVYDCMYKRCRVLSTTSKNSSKSAATRIGSFRSFSHKSTLYSRSKSRIDYRLDNDAASRLSLAVYTFEGNQQPMVTREKQKKGSHL